MRLINRLCTRSEVEISEGLGEGRDNLRDGNSIGTSYESLVSY